LAEAKKLRKKQQYQKKEMIFQTVKERHSDFSMANQSIERMTNKP